jgi:hypothetical protein
VDPDLLRFASFGDIPPATVTLVYPYLDYVLAFLTDTDDLRIYENTTPALTFLMNWLNTTDLLNYRFRQEDQIRIRSYANVK